MRLKAVGAEILAALTLACPVLAFSEPIGSDDAVIDADDTIAADTPDSDSNDTAWLSASKDTSTQVTAEVDSFYTLTVPEEITLNGSDGTGIQTGTIPVTLMGDINCSSQNHCYASAGERLCRCAYDHRNTKG